MANPPPRLGHTKTHWANCGLHGFWMSLKKTSHTSPSTSSDIGSSDPSSIPERPGASRSIPEHPGAGPGWGDQLQCFSWGSQRLSDLSELQWLIPWFVRHRTKWWNCIFWIPSWDYFPHTSFCHWELTNALGGVVVVLVYLSKLHLRRVKRTHVSYMLQAKQLPISTYKFHPILPSQRRPLVPMWPDHVSTELHVSNELGFVSFCSMDDRVPVLPPRPPPTSPLPVQHTTVWPH